jgi:hypothetical protein
MSGKNDVSKIYAIYRLGHYEIASDNMYSTCCTYCRSKLASIFQSIKLDHVNLGDII